MHGTGPLRSGLGPMIDGPARGMTGTASCLGQHRDTCILMLCRPYRQDASFRAASPFVSGFWCCSHHQVGRLSGFTEVFAVHKRTGSVPFSPRKPRTSLFVGQMMWCQLGPCFQVGGTLEVEASSSAVRGWDIYLFRLLGPPTAVVPRRRCCGQHAVCTSGRRWQFICGAQSCCRRALNEAGAFPCPYMGFPDRMQALAGRGSARGRQLLVLVLRLRATGLRPHVGRPAAEPSSCLLLVSACDSCP